MLGRLWRSVIDSGFRRRTDIAKALVRAAMIQLGAPSLKDLMPAMVRRT